MAHWADMREALRAGTFPTGPALALRSLQMTGLFESLGPGAAGTGSFVYAEDGSTLLLLGAVLSLELQT